MPNKVRVVFESENDLDWDKQQLDKSFAFFILLSKSFFTEQKTMILFHYAIYKEKKIILLIRKDQDWNWIPEECMKSIDEYYEYIDNEDLSNFIGNYVQGKEKVIQ